MVEKLLRRTEHRPLACGAAFTVRLTTDSDTAIVYHYSACRVLVARGWGAVRRFWVPLRVGTVCAGTPWLYLRVRSRHVELPRPSDVVQWLSIVRGGRHGEMYCVGGFVWTSCWGGLGDFHCVDYFEGCAGVGGRFVVGARVLLDCV